ncbi:transporter, partial [bacterium DOLZORAL124_64_63]
MSTTTDLLGALWQPGTTSTLVFLSLVAFSGILLGKIRFMNIKLGIAGVLFTGLFVAHLGAEVDPKLLHFLKEFGLILFVYAIGIEIGPRFITSFRNDGLRLNLLAALICLLGLGVTILIKTVFHLEPHVAVGILCGAVTNTPGLGSAQSLVSKPDVTGMAYAMAYPLGILGIIGVMLLLRLVFRVDIEADAGEYARNTGDAAGKLTTINLAVTNPNLCGKTVSNLEESLDKQFVLSRIVRDGESIVPQANLALAEGDLLYGLADPEHFANLEIMVGKVTPSEETFFSGHLSMRHVIITNWEVIGKTLRQLNLSASYPANITRIWRGQTQLQVMGDSTLEFGDTVRVVAAKDRMADIADFLGNSIRDLAQPHIIPLFVGIFLGVVLGSIPIFVPGLPSPAKLGLAGGPLIVALFLGHKGRVGHMSFYMTPGANFFVRELGIVIFLACVGLGSGKH